MHILRFPPRAGLALVVAAGAARAEEFRLLTGVDPGRYPGAARNVAPVPGPGFAGVFHDGQRLGGTPSLGPAVTWRGSGTPLFSPNQFGSSSFIFRRGNVPFADAPFMGIDFLGGPLLDLDGNLANGSRSLTPVIGQTPVAIPGSHSHFDLVFDMGAGTVDLTDFDATGTNEGGPGVNPGVGTTVLVVADGLHNGGAAGPINPGFDLRQGNVSAYTGAGGTLAGVYRITELPVEIWYDSVDPASGSAGELGTFQHFETFRGWLVRRSGGSFPTLAGQGMTGPLSTPWPTIDTVHVGQSFNTAFPTFGATAEIFDGFSFDVYSQTGQLGLPLTDFGGDLGAYFDAVVVPRLDPQATGFVYLESAGFGINNTGDPVFDDTNAYDMVLIAQSTESIAPLCGDVNGDAAVNAADAAALASALRDPTMLTPPQFDMADVNDDGSLDGRDVQAWLDCP